MTDASQTALIVAATAIVVAAINRKGNRVEETVSRIEVSIDGRMTQMLAIKDELIALAKTSSHAEGMKDESDARKLGNGFDQRGASKGE